VEVDLRQVLGEVRGQHSQLAVEGEAGQEVAVGGNSHPGQRAQLNKQRARSAWDKDMVKTAETRVQARGDQDGNAERIMENGGLNTNDSNGGACEESIGDSGFSSQTDYIGESGQYGKLSRAKAFLSTAVNNSR
jgi:hypothetical protein